MTHKMYFIQECPTCGRSLRIRVEYLGRELNCQHCRGKITARDPEGVDRPRGISLLQRAEELLSQSQSRSA